MNCSTLNMCHFQPQTRGFNWFKHAFALHYSLDCYSNGQHSQVLRNRALKHQQRERRIQEMGWDPASLVFCRLGICMTLGSAIRSGGPWHRRTCATKKWDWSECEAICQALSKAYHPESPRWTLWSSGTNMYQWRLYRIPYRMHISCA